MAGLSDWIINIVESHMAKKSYLEQSADEGLIDHATARGLEIALKSTHGGAGRGQGRKPSDGAIGLERRNISIDPESDAIAHRAGRDRSSGIREALRFWATHHAEE